MERMFTSLLTGILMACASVLCVAGAPEKTAQEPTAKLAGVSTYGIFHEPLVPFEPASDAARNTLELAISEYMEAADPTRMSALEDYLAIRPGTPWRTSLLLNMALVRKQAGFYTEAVALLNQAVASGKAADRLEEEKVTARALGELLSLYTQFGDKASLKAMLEQVDEGPASASVSELIAQARSGLFQLEKTPQDVLTCGLDALDKLIGLQSPTESQSPQFLDVKASAQGISLATLQGLADRAGLPTEVIERNADAPFPVPSVMHLKVGHYATVLREQDDRYEVFDPALKETLWFTREAMDTESSGHFLVTHSADSTTSPAWSPVDPRIAESIFGAGNTSGNTAEDTSCDSESLAGIDCEDICPGMPRYRVHSMLVSLNILDTPVAYATPIGPDIDITLSYSQREAYQPTTYTFGNFGPKWMFNWLSYVRDNPQQPGSGVRLYLPGGGSRTYSGYDPVSGTFIREQRTGAVLKRVSGSPVQYEREMADGTRYIYAESDGSTGTSRRIFLTEVIDSGGNRVELGFDSQQRLVSLTDALGQITTFHYAHADDPLLITGVTDPFGRAATFDYDSSGRLNSITDAEGMTSTFDYENGTFIEAMTTPYGTTRFRSGASGTTRWLDIIDPNGEHEVVVYRHSGPGISFSDSPLPSGMNLFNRYINSRNTFYWDKEAWKRVPYNYTQASIQHWYHLRTNGSLTTGVLESIKEPLERRVWFNYPGQGWPGAEGTLDKPSIIGRVLPDGVTQLKRRSYNVRGNLTRSIDPLGREVRYEYAANDIDLARILRKTASGFETLAEFTHNNDHQPLTYTGPDGQVYAYTYNVNNQLLTVTSPLGHVTAYDYDNQGYLLGITDANGVRLVSYDYDNVGRKVSETNAAGFRLEYAYDDLDRLMAIRFPDGTRETYIYDNLDRVSVTDRYGNTTTQTYDAVRNRTAVRDASGHQRDYDYFADGELQRITDGKGHTTEYQRDIQSRIIKTIRQDASVYQMAYDNAGRQTTHTDPLGGVTRFGYDSDDKLDSVTDPNGNTTTYDYHPYTGLLTAQNSPDTGSTTYEYDSDNNLTRQVDARGQATDFDYDTLNRITRIAYSDGQSADYHYDSGRYGKGRLTSIEEDDVTTTFAYAERGNVSQRTQSSGSATLNTRYRYTPMGNLSQVVYPSGTVVDYEYVNDRLSRILANGQPVLDNLHYEAFGPIKSWHWGSGLTHHRSYDAAGLLETFSLNGDTRTLTYDSVNNIRGVDDSRIDQDFVYDYLDRLTAAQSISSTPEHNYTLSYDYDANGNRTRSEVDGTTDTYTTEATSNRLMDANGVSKTYDANGNLIADGAHTYQYDARNRLVSVDHGVTGRYRYNALGQRIYKKALRRYQLTADVNSDGEVNNDDIHDLDDLIKAGQHPAYADLTRDGVVDKQDNACVAVEIGSNGNEKGPKRCHNGEWVETTVESHFLYQGPNLLGEYDVHGQVRQEIIWLGNIPVAVLQDNKLYRIHTDHLGTPVIITDSENTAVWRWDRRPFGDTAADDDPDGDGQAFVFNIRLPGQYFDRETEFHYNYFRDYDPSIGRYVQSDPIGLGGGLNTFGYVAGNPLSYYDEYGLIQNVRQPRNIRNARNIRRQEQLRRQQQSTRDRINNILREAERTRQTLDQMLGDLSSQLDNLDQQLHPQFPTVCVEWDCPWDDRNRNYCIVDSGGPSLEPPRNPLEGCRCVRRAIDPSGF